MSDEANVKKPQVMEEIELKEWLASLDYVLSNGSPERVQYLLQQLQIRAQESGITLPFTLNTLISIQLLKKNNLHFQEIVIWNAGLKALSAGMRWPWSLEPTKMRMESVDTYLPSPPLQPSMKWVLTTFLGLAKPLLAVIWSIFRDTPPQGCILVLSWKDA